VSYWLHTTSRRLQDAAIPLSPLPPPLLPPLRRHGEVSGADPLHRLIPAPSTLPIGLRALPIAPDAAFGCTLPQPAPAASRWRWIAGF